MSETSNETATASAYTSASESGSCSNWSMQLPVCRFLYIGLPLIGLLFVGLGCLCCFLGSRRRRKVIGKRNNHEGLRHAETFVLSGPHCEASEAELRKKKDWESWWSGKLPTPTHKKSPSANFKRLSYESYASMTLQNSSSDTSLRYAESTISNTSVRTSFEDIDLEAAQFGLATTKCGESFYQEIAKAESENWVVKPILNVKPILTVRPVSDPLPSYTKDYPGGIGDCQIMRYSQRDVPDIRLSIVVEEKE